MKLAFAVPSMFVNNMHIASVNGIIRLTFFEHSVFPEANPPADVMIPRTSVCLPKENAYMMAKTIESFIAQLDEPSPDERTPDMVQ